MAAPRAAQRRGAGIASEILERTILRHGTFASGWGRLPCSGWRLVVLAEAAA
jgi:hypothetical protein